MIAVPGGGHAPAPALNGLGMPADADNLLGGQEEEEQQRERNVRAKQERQSMLQEKAQFIRRIRKLAHAQAQVKKSALLPDCPWAPLTQQAMNMV